MSELEFWALITFVWAAVAIPTAYFAIRLSDYLQLATLS